MITDAGIECAVVRKVGDGRPDVADMLKNEKIDLIINTTEGRQSIEDSAVIRRLALSKKVCYTTTMAAAEAICISIKEGASEDVRCLQELHARLPAW